MTFPARKLTTEELRAWLDRAPPKPPDLREWEEFEFERVHDGHTRMVTAPACVEPQV